MKIFSVHSAADLVYLLSCVNVFFINFIVKKVLCFFIVINVVAIIFKYLQTAPNSQFYIMDNYLCSLHAHIMKLASIGSLNRF